MVRYILKVAGLMAMLMFITLFTGCTSGSGQAAKAKLVEEDVLHPYGEVGI